MSRTGHYLSPGKGGGWRILGGITWFLGEQKGASVVTENPKGGITENFGRIQRGRPLKFANMENEDIMGGGGWGDRESHQMLLGGITSVK